MPAKDCSLVEISTVPNILDRRCYEMLKPLTLRERGRRSGYPVQGGTLLSARCSFKNVFLLLSFKALKKGVGYSKTVTRHLIRSSISVQVKFIYCIGEFVIFLGNLCYHVLLILARQEVLHPSNRSRKNVLNLSSCPLQETCQYILRLYHFVCC